MGIQQNVKVDRNRPCPCKSGLKGKFCHGDQQKLAICNQIARGKMLELIFIEKKKRGLIPCKYKCQACDKGFDVAVHSELNESVLKCPFCEDTRVESNPKYEALVKEMQQKAADAKESSGTDEKGKGEGKIITV